MCMQLHTWVTAMALTSEPLKPWTAREAHPSTAMATRSSKCCKTSEKPCSSVSHHALGNAETQLPSRNPSGVSQSRKGKSTVLDPPATSAAIGPPCHIVDSRLSAAATFDVQNVCRVMACGDPGRVCCARYIVILYSISLCVYSILYSPGTLLSTLIAMLMQCASALRC